MIKEIANNKVFQNAGWLICGKIAQMMISLVVSVLTARFLGPANYGLISYGTAYTAFFMSFCTLGINSILVKEFTDGRYDEGTLLGTTLILRTVSSILSIGIIFCIVSLVDADEPTAILVTLLCCVGLIFQIFDTFNYWFQFRLQSKVTAIASFLAYAVTAGYKVVLLILKKNVMWFAFATSVDYICVAIVLFYCYQKYNGKKLRFSRKCGEYLLSKSYHFILTGIMVAVYGYVDKFMLKQMIGEVETGYYSTAMAICNMWCFVLSAIISSMYPTITSSYKSNNLELFKRRNKQLYAIVFYTALGVSAVISILGRYIVFVLYGAAYLPAVGPLRIVTWYTAFSYLGVARDAWVVCENKQRYLKFIYLLAAFSNVVLNALLIPVWGASGAALASLITQIITIIAPVYIKPIRENAQLMLEAILLKGVFLEKRGI